MITRISIGKSPSAIMLKVKRLLLAPCCLLWLGPALHAQSSVRGPLRPEHTPSFKFQSFSPERWDTSSFAPAGAQQWWQEARLGMFVHFGVASLKGVELGWGRGTHLSPDGGTGPIPDEVYDNLYKDFKLENFDAKEWVNIARSAGAKYIVIVTKHHDGFHMWDTAFSDYKITNSPFDRDYIKELADACHAAGMPIGFYFAQREFYHPQYNPRGNLAGRDHKKYLEYQFNAVRELLTKYGKIDILWLDAAWWGGMFKEEDWDAERLYRLIRECQPQILINNRASIPGDFDTPEQHVGNFQHDRPWESCVTLTSQWSYHPTAGVKSVQQLISLLVQTSTGDGNLLLNVGPMPTGEIQPKEVAALKGVGEWLKKYGVSVYHTRGGPLRNSTWGGTTYRGDTVYVHILRWPGPSLPLAPIDEKIVSARALTGGAVKFEQSAGVITLSMDEKDRDPLDTIIELKLDRPVTKIYEAKAAPSIFDGPGYGEVISGAATFTASSSWPEYDDPSLHPTLFTGKNQDYAFHTMSEKSPWAIIDLGGVKNIKGLRIANRRGDTRARDLEVLVSADKSEWTPVWKAASHAEIWSVPVTQFVAGAYVPGKNARYVKLQLPEGASRPLLLKQVEVFGEQN
ncbi:alpha-L-fucosidase [Luteolibacter arcticus]|uniref:alpha-L-fucosidase n=1 Tax=Luteolibacter arcticus TaxID=1581411 RepID=A0ABT3GK15_9BACT|nr:alpha-L-fucosidase [Luteolibacter arcticus]MCW1923859.1 alpha-L-fucosidase [Luteolibacter arcticus]